MRAPQRTELRQALQAIRLAADAVKAYEPDLIEELAASIRAFATAIHGAPDLAPEAAAMRDRVIANCGAVSDAIERAARYPDLPMARAAVLDQVMVLARSLRDLQTLIGPG